MTGTYNDPPLGEWGVVAYVGGSLIPSVVNSFNEKGRGILVAGQEDRLLTPGEVAKMFRVDPKTVTRWAEAGKIHSIRTPGNHHRFWESEIRAVLEGGGDRP